jgi:hypothetical protein
MLSCVVGIVTYGRANPRSIRKGVAAVNVHTTTEAAFLNHYPEKIAVWKAPKKTLVLGV